MIAPAKEIRGGRGSSFGRALAGLVMGALLLLASSGLAWTAKGQNPTRPRSAPEPAVKAAAILKILPFVQWPTNTFAASNSTFVMVVLDAPEVAAQLQKVAAEQKIGDHPIQVRRQMPDSCQDVQLIYVGRDYRRGLAGVPEAVRHSPILLVGEQPGFARSGGTINLLLTAESSQIEISRGAASRVGIRFSSHLASLRAIQWIDDTHGQ